jgi:predicted TIM-barrel fold metal-dependent hydrolase
MKIVDIHGHLWSKFIDDKRYMSPEAEEKWFNTAFLGSDPVLNADAVKLIQAINRAEQEFSDEYSMAVFAIDIHKVFPMEVSIEGLNNWVSQQASIDKGGRIIPFACIDPTRENAVDEARRCVNELHTRGFKLYPPTGFYPNEERISHFYEEVISLQEQTGNTLPLLFHQGFCFSGSKYAQPIYLEDVAFRYKPALKIIIAHAGIPWVDEALSIAALHQNVYLDIALFGDLYGFWPELHLQLFGKAKRAGVLDRVLFGSDWPLSSGWMPSAGGDPAWVNLQQTVSAIRGLRMPDAMREMGYPEITETDIENILGGNAAALMELHF